MIEVRNTSATKREFTGMKMAKASKRDLDAALRLLTILGAVESGEFWPDLEWGDDIEHATLEDFEENKFDHLRIFYNQITEISKRAPAGLNRIIWGYDTLVSDHNEMVDPNNSALELHPRLIAALEYKENYENLLKEALQLSGGWREAIVELGDFCHEPVRLKNMVAAADQISDWSKRAQEQMAKMENPNGK